MQVVPEQCIVQYDYTLKLKEWLQNFKLAIKQPFEA